MVGRHLAVGLILPSLLLFVVWLPRARGQWHPVGVQEPKPRVEGQNGGLHWSDQGGAAPAYREHFKKNTLGRVFSSYVGPRSK